MKYLARNVSLVFFAGCLGGFVNGIAVWVSGILDFTTKIGVDIVPILSLPWLYSRIIWGGLWGLLFLFPLKQKNFFLKGLIFSLAPSLMQLFVVFPKTHKGIMGIELGLMTPLFVIIFNAIWGLSTALWLKFIKA